MLGRFCPAGGKVGVIAGSLGLRDHAERLEGFLAVMAAEFPALTVVGPLEGHDQRAETEALTHDLLARHADLVGLYNLGAGNAGLLAALEATGHAGKLRVIAHELTGPTRRGPASGAIDVVLDQNPDHEIRAAHRRGPRAGAARRRPLSKASTSKSGFSSATICARSLRPRRAAAAGSTGSAREGFHHDDTPI